MNQDPLYLYRREGAYIPRIAAVHDLCGYGKCSLGVAIPVLSAAGCDVCPVPTGLFSSHTAFPGWYMHDTTEMLADYLAAWKNIGVEIDAVYSGFLGAPEQVDRIRDLYEMCIRDSFQGGALHFGADGARVALVGRERARAHRGEVVHSIHVHAGGGIVESLLGHDLHRRQGIGVPARPQHGHGHLHAFDPLLDDHMLVEGKGVEDGLTQVVLAIHAMDAQGGAAMRRFHGHRETADHAVFHQVERRGGAHVLERVARDADALRP